MGTTAEKLAALVASKADIAAAITEKGGTVPVRFSEYGDAIRALQTASPLSIPRQLTTTTLNVPTQSMPVQYSPGSQCKTLGGYVLSYAFMGSPGLTKVDLSSVTVVNPYSLQYAFYGCTNLTEVDFSSLTNVGSQQVFYNAMAYCSKLLSISFPRLANISGELSFYNAFAYSGLKTADFSSLTYICGRQAFYNAFSNCSNLESAIFSELVAIGYKGTAANSATQTGYGHFAAAFLNCPKLTALSFPKLIRIYSSGSNASSSVFYNCNKIQVINLPKLASISGAGGKYLFSNCSSLTEIHFAAENEDAIRATEGFSTLWGRGAGAATVYFDL